MSDVVLQAVDLVKHFPVDRSMFGRRRVVHALDGVSLELQAHETLAVVGESGCGKSTLARCLVRLMEPTRGTIRVAGHSVTGADAEARRAIPRLIQIVFQDPYASLNPRRTIFQTIADPLRIRGACPGAELRHSAGELLESVGIGGQFLDRLPHELSGGQRQRVAIARALAMGPKVVVCDEPVSALDVSVQAQVINLLRRLQRERGMSYLFITHDLRLVRNLADRVAVMYLGQIVELAPMPVFRERMRHPYSHALFSATPNVNGIAGSRVLLAGDVPSPIDPPAGCRFHTRCPYVQDICRTQEPALRDLDGSAVRCHLAEALDLAPAAVAQRASA